MSNKKGNVKLQRHGDMQRMPKLVENSRASDGLSLLQHCNARITGNACLDLSHKLLVFLVLIFSLFFYIGM